MRWILLSLLSVNIGCAARTGSGALSASNIPMSEGYMPKTRMKEKACNWRLFNLIPIGQQTRAEDIQARMARGANGITDIVIETETVAPLLLVSMNCTTVTATPVTTGGSNE